MVLQAGADAGRRRHRVGVVAAFLLTRLMQSLLYQVRPSDPVTFASCPIALVVVALLASALPAYRRHPA